MKKEKVLKESFTKAWAGAYGGVAGTAISAMIFTWAGAFGGGAIGHFVDIHESGNPDVAVDNAIKAELDQNLKSLIEQERGFLAAEALLKEKIPAQILLGISNAESRQAADKNLIKARQELEAAKTAFSVRLLTDMHLGEETVKDVSEEAISKLSTNFPTFYQWNGPSKEHTAFYSRGLRECQRQILASPEKYKVSYGSNVKTAEIVSVCSNEEGTYNIDIGIWAGLGISLMAMFALPALSRREIKNTPVKAVLEPVIVRPPAEEKPKKKLRLES